VREVEKELQSTEEVAFLLTNLNQQVASDLMEAHEKGSRSSREVGQKHLPSFLELKSRVASSKERFSQIKTPQILESFHTAYGRFLAKLLEVISLLANAYYLMSEGSEEESAKTLMRVRPMIREAIELQSEANRELTRAKRLCKTTR